MNPNNLMEMKSLEKITVIQNDSSRFQNWKIKRILKNQQKGK